MTNVPAAQAVQLMEISGDGAAGNAAFGENMELIRNVKVRVSACVGQCELTVQQLFALKSGEVVTLDRASHDPVELYLDSRLIGRGELVVVGDRFGVRILDLGVSREA